jgi:uncharacterized protein (TIGR02453 family)
MQRIATFLEELRRNNDREWFSANKSRYLEVQALFNSFTERLIYYMSEFDPTLSNLTVKDCTYRIYRDIRFSPNKDPYKTHMGAYICAGGKNSGNAGYYFHIEPIGEQMMGGNIMVAGLYLPEKSIQQSVRDDISVNGDDYAKAIKSAKGFALDESSKLKRLPLGFTVGNPYDELIKLRDFNLGTGFGDEILTASDPAAVVAEMFKRTHGFVRLLNRAVEYARENM